jgi:stage V sporulation protein G
VHPHPQPVSDELKSGPEDLTITEIRVRLHRGRPDDILRAFVSVTLNGCFAVHNLKVIEKEGGTFVSMPARRNRDGAFSDIAHPINREFRTYMESVVLLAYERELGRNGSS